MSDLLQLAAARYGTTPNDDFLAGYAYAVWSIRDSFRFLNEGPGTFEEEAGILLDDAARTTVEDVISLFEIFSQIKPVMTPAMQERFMDLVNDEDALGRTGDDSE